MIANQHTIDAIFFDLDGTLLDTAADLNNACNDILRKYAYPTVPLELFRHYISGGTQLIVSKSFNIEIVDEKFQQIKQEFLQSYQQQLTRETKLFPEINTLLDFLDEQQIPWGVVTGKPSYLAAPILEHFGLMQRSRCLVAGDTVFPGKPDPAPLLHACQLLACSAPRCLYVGDADTDIMAAEAAGMLAVAVSYGYNGIDNDPLTWNAHFVAQTPCELLTYIQKAVRDKFC